MFCSECGKPARGKFCSHCGTPLALEAGLKVVSPDDLLADDVVAVELVPEWDREIHVETILKYPGVRETIDRHAQLAPKRLSGEQFLELADKLVPLGVPMVGLAAVVHTFYSKLGVKTGKERAHCVAAPVGRVIVRALCSLARNGQKLRGVSQAADGCLLEAALPSDLFSFEGDLLVTVRREGTHAEVRGATRISGQFFDAGKSTRCLDRLFADLASDNLMREAA